MPTTVAAREQGSVGCCPMWEKGSEPHVRLVVVRHDQVISLSLSLKDAVALGKELQADTESLDPSVRVTLPEPG